MAKEAAEKTKNAIANDQADMESLVGEIKNILGEDGSGGADPSEEPKSKLQTDGNYDEKGKVNSPKLGTGMRAVVYKDGEWKEPSSNEEWYNYGEKKWANAMTEDGSMWVWIPRYAYKITSNYHNGGADVVGTVDIKFLKNTGEEPADGTESSQIVASLTSEEVQDATGNVGPSKDGKYVVHPAFKWGAGNSQVSGIWVAKFEASKEDAGSKDTTTLKVVPDVTSWREIRIDKIYTTCKSYNSALNSHQMKNSEWGAVAYLTQSSYGKGTEVAMNQCSSYLTGMGPGDEDDGVRGASSYAYKDTGIEEFSKVHGYLSDQGKKASTTGNETGIYDMSGGAYEYVAAYVNNGDSNLTGNGGSLVNSSDSWTKDIYTESTELDTGVNNYTQNKGVYGDAVYETSKGAYSTSETDKQSWYGDYSIFPRSSGPFFIRGGAYSNSGTYAGLFFFGINDGDSSSTYGFRPVLVP